jgi:hypothetical protein
LNNVGGVMMWHVAKLHLEMISPNMACDWNET